MSKKTNIIIPVISFVLGIGLLSVYVFIDPTARQVFITAWQSLKTILREIITPLHCLSVAGVLALLVGYAFMSADKKFQRQEEFEKTKREFEEIKSLPVRNPTREFQKKILQEIEEIKSLIIRKPIKFVENKLNGGHPFGKLKDGEDINDPDVMNFLKDAKLIHDEQGYTAFKKFCKENNKNPSTIRSRIKKYL